MVFVSLPRPSSKAAESPRKKPEGHLVLPTKFEKDFGEEENEEDQGRSSQKHKKSEPYRKKKQVK